VKKLLWSFLLLSITVPSVVSAGPPALESLQLKDLGHYALTAAPLPALSPAPAAAGYDWSGLPAYIFTEEEKVSDAVVSAIGRTGCTLDVALYNLQIPAASKALIQARDRGVKVRVILDYDHVYPKAGKEMQDLVDAGLDVRVMKGRAGSGSMHCKFALFDGSLLETGSANWSLSAENASYENLMFVSDQHILQGYQADFEWLWRQARPAGKPEAPAGKPTAPPADPAPSVSFNGAVLPNYIFSPRGGTEAAMVKAIDSSRSEVDVAMFSFTSKPAMAALVRASSRGVKVKMLLYVKSAFPFREEVKKNNIEVRLKDGRVGNGLMHNKYAVLDASLLINGSFNWSDTAENLNTENTIFTLSPVYVSPYKAEFDKLFLDAAALSN
jgi:phosphatidylserine/phosphatidylglycerophosphate/cardiolipin synthase-like enzyme